MSFVYICVIIEMAQSHSIHNNTQQILQTFLARSLAGEPQVIECVGESENEKEMKSKL